MHCILVILFGLSVLWTTLINNAPICILFVVNLCHIKDLTALSNSSWQWNAALYITEGENNDALILASKGQSWCVVILDCSPPSLLCGSSNFLCFVDVTGTNREACSDSNRGGRCHCGMHFNMLSTGPLSGINHAKFTIHNTIRHHINYYCSKL